jgi:hypothetical protein
MAIEIIVQKMGQELKYDSDKLIAELMNPFDANLPAENKYFAPQLAREEIARVLSDETEGKNFKEILNDFENSIAQYINENIHGLVLEVFGRVSLEAIFNQFPLINDYLDSSNLLTTDERKELVKSLFRVIRSNISKRLGITRGGSRKKSENKEFSWTKETKVAFYQGVENLPKDKGETFWQFAIRMLIVEADFSSDTINFIKSRPLYKSVPSKLFDEARTAWLQYHNVASLKEIPAEIKPRAFDLRHALFILNYPDENPYLTLLTYYYDGKKLMK